MKTLEDAELTNKKVLLIADYNTKDLSNHFKIQQTIPTIRKVLEKFPRVLFIVTHRGRPKTPEEFSTIPIYQILKDTVLIKLKYSQISCYCDESHPSSIADEHQFPVPEIYFGDNTRYYSDNELIRFYSLFDTIINDAFGTVHRPSTFTGYAGLLLQSEVKVLSSAREFDLLIIGGAKVDEKIKAIKRFNGKVFLGGLLKYRSHESTGSTGLILPIDFKVIDKSGKLIVKVLEDLEDADTVIDIGKMSIEALLKEVEKSKSILWNGPLGKFEDERATSTRLLVQGLAKCQAKVVAGGGETLTAIQKYSDVNKFSHVSTGGGAMLAFLGDGSLPGLKSVE